MVRPNPARLSRLDAPAGAGITRFPARLRPVLERQTRISKSPPAVPDFAFPSIPPRDVTPQATEQKKEAFRKYLESAGVIDSLTKVLVSLYEEPDKPATAIDFLKANLGGPTPAEYEALEEEKNTLAAELEATKKELAETQAKLEAAEAAAAAAPAEGEEAPAE